MLKYYLIIILNLPLVLFGIARTLRVYASGRFGRLRLVLWMIFWVALAVALFFAQPFYQFLENRHLTDSTPLSLFDVFEITGIIFLLMIALRLYSKIDQLEQRLSQLNREISIQLSKPRGKR